MFTASSCHLLNIRSSAAESVPGRLLSAIQYSDLTFTPLPLLLITAKMIRAGQRLHNRARIKGIELFKSGNRTAGLLPISESDYELHCVDVGYEPAAGTVNPGIFALRGTPY
jgi:hypothetical protein